MDLLKINSGKFTSAGEIKILRATDGSPIGSIRHENGKLMVYGSGAPNRSQPLACVATVEEGGELLIARDMPSVIAEPRRVFHVGKGFVRIIADLPGVVIALPAADDTGEFLLGDTLEAFAVINGWQDQAFRVDKITQRKNDWSAPNPNKKHLRSSFARFENAFAALAQRTFKHVASSPSAHERLNFSSALAAARAEIAAGVKAAVVEPWATIAGIDRGMAGRRADMRRKSK